MIMNSNKKSDNNDNNSATYVFNSFFFLFTAAPEACGSSQARGQIEAAAEAYTTATATPDLSCICNLCCSL